MKTRSWNRILWGVKFTDSTGRVLMIGDGWDHYCRHHNGEPSRPLLFMTRDQARAWCKSTNANYKGENDDCEKWKFTPVRVREIVTEL